MGRKIRHTYSFIPRDKRAPAKEESPKKFRFLGIPLLCVGRYTWNCPHPTILLMSIFILIYPYYCAIELYHICIFEINYENGD